MEEVHECHACDVLYYGREYIGVNAVVGPQLSWGCFGLGVEIGPEPLGLMGAHFCIYGQSALHGEQVAYAYVSHRVGGERVDVL